MTTISVLWLLLVAAFLYLGSECALHFLVRHYRKTFPWLITEADIAPVIRPEIIESHLARSFDSELGWCRKPGTRGTDEVSGGTVGYAIDALGRRTNPDFQDEPPMTAVFGDSFAFSRLVNDDETWAYHLSHLLGHHVANYGVGNYGLDQALLRLERELSNIGADVVVMAVVPETIIRIHSYWKHYFEYGNLLAFKPRFTLDSGSLSLHPAAVRNAEGFSGYRSNLSEIMYLDPFFETKFSKDILRFPYLPRVLLRARRHGAILVRLVAGSVTGNAAYGQRRAFDVILRENATWTRRYFADEAACALLAALIRRFFNNCRDHGKKGLLTIIPQPWDINPALGPTGHEAFLEKLPREFPVRDLTPDFRSAAGHASLFVQGALGDHPSVDGNRFIAEAIAPVLRELHQA